MIDKNASDSLLVSQFLGGQEKCLEILIRRYKNRVFTTIYHVVKDRYIAEDLLQDTFIKAVRCMQEGGYNEEGRFLPWISRIAKNMAIDHYRKMRRHPKVVFNDGSSVFNSLDFSEDSSESIRIAAENQSLIRDCIRRLPEEQRQVLLMRQYQELSFREIAELTGVSINTALGRMRYALLNMKKMIHKIPPLAYDANLYPRRLDPVPVPRNLSGGKPAA